ESTNQKPLPCSLCYKSRAQQPVASFYLRDMEDEKAFALQLAIYQKADLGDYINFMIQFRSSLNALKPADVIALEPIYTVDLVEQMQQLLPHLDPREIPTFQSFVYFEPADVFDEYLEQEASKGKGAFIDAEWIQGKGRLYRRRVDCDWQTQTVPFGAQRLDRAWSPDSRPLDKVGSNRVEWVLRAAMAR
ncbi:hypothetical protein TNIN_305461, partial [Trichonephila inaurata madagascariensis]